VIGVRRLWKQPWRDTNCQDEAIYYDLTVMELGKLIYRDMYMIKKGLKSLPYKIIEMTFLKFL
jgi:hypothetical protein